MRDREHARIMLEAARKDLRALEGMRDAEIFADEIFGFHAQQAVEKGLKAWFSLLGVNYPRIHDIEELLTMLESQGTSIPSLDPGVFIFFLDNPFPNLG